MPDCNDEQFEELAYPINCETEDLDGCWILINLTRWLGNGKWLAYDEDGIELVVDSSHIRNPKM